jgi:hypothetical protein
MQMSGKWNDISTGETECYELLAPTVRGVVTRQHDAGPDTQFSVSVEESGGAKHYADRRFADLTEAKIWAENEMARIVGQQTDV